MKRIIAELPTGVKNINRYQAGKTTAEVKAEFDLKKIVKLASNENPAGPAPEVIETIKKEAADVFLYPDSDCRTLKSVLAAKYQLNKEKIFIGNGSDEIIDLLMTLILNPGDQVIQADPAFIKYELAVKSRGGKAVKTDLDKNYRHDLKAIENKINNKTKAVFICNPNNPTGTMLSQNEISSFIERVSEEILIIIDQAYLEYITADHYFDGIELLAEHSNLLLLRTFSKAYALAGMRVGYALGSEKIFNYLNRIRGPFNVNRLAQKAAAAAVEAEDYLQKCLAENEKEKKFLYHQFKKMQLKYIETETNFIMFKTPFPAELVFKKLQQRGVIIRPGNQFGMKKWLRVTIGSREQNKFFSKNLEEFLAEESE